MDEVSGFRSAFLSATVTVNVSPLFATFADVEHREPQVGQSFK